MTLRTRLLALSLALPGLSLPLVVDADEKAPATVAERIAAVVNSDVILLSEVRERAFQMGQMPASGELSPTLQKQLLDKMIDDQLVLQQATELKLSVDSAEVDRAIEEVKKSNKIEDDDFVAALKEQGYTMASYRKDLRRQLLRLKVLNTAVRAHVNVSDDEVRAFYDQSARKAGTARSARVRHVLVAVPANADAKTKAAKRAEAEKLVAAVKAGKPLAELARTVSDDTLNRDRDGELGWLSESDGLAQPLADAIFGAEPNEVRGPVQTDKGFEIVEVLEKKSEVRPFEEVKETIRQQLYQQQLEKQTQTWLSELRKKAHVDVRN